MSSTSRLVIVACITALAAACSVDPVTFIQLDANEVDAIDAPVNVQLVVTPTDITVGETQSMTFTVALTENPGGDLPVSLTSGEMSKVLVTPTQLAFDENNWMSPQTVTVSGRDDVDTENEDVDVTVASGRTNPVTVNVTVTDDDQVEVIATPSTMLDVTEAATAPLNVRLSSQPSATTTVTVGSADTSAATVAPATLTFTIANWNVDQTVVVSGVIDADTTDENTTINLGGAGLTSVSVPIRVIDRDVLGISPSTTNLGSLPEGGAGSFGVTLTQQPPDNVTVSVASSDGDILTVAPTALTFTPANWNVAQTVSVTAPDDLDTGNETGSITLSATGMTTRTVAAAVTDDDVQTIIANPIPLPVDEGGARDLNVRLAFQPAGDVTLAVTSLNTTLLTVTPATLTFTPANYDTSQPVTASALEDQDAQAGMTAIRLESAAQSLLTDIPVSITDNDQLTIETSTTAVTLGEAGTAMFGVRLTAMPGATVVVNVNSGDPSAASVAPVALSFSTVNWNAFQMVTVTGVNDLDLASEAVTITLAASGLPAKTVDATVNDDDTQEVLVSSATIQVNENGNGTVGVNLRYAPASNVTVNLSSADTGTATVAPATLTFTPANFATPQTVTIAGVDDGDVADDTTTITASATGATAGTVAVTVADDDVLGIQTNVTTTTVTEGLTGTVGVRLSAQPAASTTVTIASSDTGAATVSTGSLTFTTANWNTYQNVTVTGVDDADAGNESVTLTLTSPPLTMRTVTVSVTDNDTQDIVTTAGAVSIGEGGTATFGVHLAAQPAGDVVVMINSADITAVTASPGALTFTPANYATNQTVTLTGLEDVDLTSESVAITASASGLPTRTVTASVTDNDMQVILAAPTTLTVAEGNSGSVGVSLQFQPAADVTVTVAPANGAIADVTPGTLTFTPSNFATAQNVVVSGVEDADAVTSNTSVTATAPAATSASVAVTVTDNDVLALETSVSALTVTEGTPDTFGVRLTAQPAGDTMVTVMSSDINAATVAPAVLTFTTANWNAFQNVTVTGVGDLDAVNEAATITVASAGFTSRTVNATVTDDEVQGIVTTASSVSLTEGATATFGVRLAAMPTSDVVVMVTSNDTGAGTAAPTMLTFTPANYTTNQTVTVSGTADFDLASESVTLSLASSGLPTVTVTAAITDDDVQVVNVSPGTVNVTEGGTGSFGVTLGFMPAANVTVTVSSVSTGVATVSPATLTFTPANYNTSQNVTVTAPHDADLAPGSTSITATAPGATTGTVNVTVTDDDMQVVQVSTGTVGVTEGSSTTFGVTLGFAPSANVTVTIASGNTAVATTSPATLTFTPANYNNSQTVTVTAPQDANLVANSTTITASAGGATSGTVTVNVTDDDTQAVLVTPGTLAVTEGSSGTVNVSLAFQPASSVMVTMATGNASVATVATTTLTFTTANYNTPQAVTVNAVQDADMVAGSTSVTGSLSGATTGTTTVNVTDDDTQVVQVSTGTLAVTEGGNTTFGVTLGFVPTSNVTVTVASGNAAVATVAPTTLTFTPANYSTSQSVTVTAPQDADLANNSTAVTATAAGAATGTVTVNVTDNDVQVVQVSPGTITPTEGGTGSFGVTLGFVPSANVTVMVMSNNAAVATVSPATLTFTPANYNASQNVTVTAVQDADLVASSTTVTASAAMATAGTVTVNVTDDDTQVVNVSTGTLSITEGNTGTVGVTLGFVPSGSVTVTVTSGNTALATVSPGTLTFTAATYNMPQNVTVTGVQDADLTGGSTSVTATAPGATSGSFTVNVTDDDVQRAVVNPAALSLTEGGNGSFGVTLAFAPTSDITVNVISGNAAVATVAPSTLTFTPANFNVSQTVTVTAPQDADLVASSTSVTVSEASITSGAVVVDVADNDVQTVLVSPGSLVITEGASTTFGVTLGFVPTGTTTVTVSSGSTAVATVTPATLTFTAGDYNVSQTVTVTAPQDVDLVTNSTTITATAPGATSGSLGFTQNDNDTQIVVMSSPTLSLTEGDSRNLTVSLGFQPTANVAVAVASSNTASTTVTPAMLTFTPANWNVGQPITLSAPHDVDLASSAATITGSLAGATSGTIAVSVTDDDTQRVVTTPSTIALTEGGSGTAGFSLAFQPAGNVTVTVASSDTSLATVGTASLTFTPANYATVQNVTVSAPQDLNLVGGTATITGSASGATSGTIAVPVTEDDVQAVIVNPTTITNMQEGTSVTVNARLAFIPTADTVVTGTTTNSSVATFGAPTTRTFTAANYNVDQVFTINAVEDIDLVGNSVTMKLDASGATGGNISVTTVDNDTQVVRGTPTAINTTEGNSTTIAVTLDFAPAANVTVNVASSNTGVATVSPATLTFTPTNYATAQNVTVTAVHDADLAAGSAVVSMSSAGATPATTAVNVTDDDTQIVQFNTASVSVTEGTSSSAVGIRLGFVPAANVTVTVASSNTGAATVTPSTLTFTPATYNTYQFITITGTSDADVVAESCTITGTAPGATSGSTAVTVPEDDVQSITVSTTALGNLAEGQATSFTVRLAFMPSADTTVTVGSNDTTAVTVSPTTLTFTSANYFTPQTVTVSAINDTDLVHESVTITASSPGLTSRTVTVTAADNDLLEDPPNVSSPCFGTDTVSYNLLAVPLGNVTVTATVQSGGAVTISPATRTFTTANWSTPQTFIVTHDYVEATTNSTITFTATGQTSKSMTATTTYTFATCEGL